MNAKNRTIIIKDLTAYLPKEREIAKTEQGIWNDVLREKDYRIAARAFKLLFKENPPCNTFGKLPDSRRFEEIYESIAKPVIKHCSCCAGSTFIVFKFKDGRELAHDCICYLNAGLPPRTAKFTDHGWTECDSLNCPNPEKKETIIVARGSFLYYKKELSTCRYLKTITEEADNEMP